jgi:hypothetical protein
VPILPVLLCLLPLPAGAALYHHAEKRSRARWTKSEERVTSTTSLQGPYRGEVAMVVASGEARAPAEARRGAAACFAASSVSASVGIGALLAFGPVGALALPIAALAAFFAAKRGYDVLDGRTARAARRGGIPTWMEKALERKRARLPPSSGGTPAET